MKEGKDSFPKGKQALYRRYRSTSFDELVGQEHVTELLKAAVKNGTFSHAYLFTGQRGTGKTSAARILAYAINGLPYDAENSHLDIIEIDAASNRRIDDIRDLREKVFVAPVSAKYKVYIIDEVHMLTGESFNALLKTLEEPPEHAVFILATTELHKVPATIISRTQRFHFRPVALSKVIAHLKDIAKKEKIDITDDALKLIAEHGGGSFRDSISLLDQLGSFGGPITPELVEATLGRARSADISEVLGELKANDHDALHATLERMLSEGTSPVTLSEQLVAALLAQQAPKRERYELIEKLMFVPKAHFPQLLLLSTLLGFTAEKADKTIDSSQSSVDRKSQSDTSSSDKTSAQTRESNIKTQRVTDGGAAPTSDKIPQNFSEEGADRLAGPASSELRSEAEGEANDASGERSREESHQEGNDGERADDTTAFNWKKVLDVVKKANPALYAMLAKADYRYENNTLTLTFAYALYRKKLDQTQYRTQLARFIQDTCGTNPTLVIDQNGPQLAATDETTKKVADLMGGGERVAV